MAAAYGSKCLANIRKYAFHSARQFSTIKQNNYHNKIKLVLSVVGGGIAVYAAYKNRSLPEVYAIKNNGEKKNTRLSSKETRFTGFSSVEYDGQLLMTPKDFLDSIVEVELRAHVRRKVLNQKDIDKIKNITPSLKENNSHMFRSLGDTGIISYSEYLFLLSILTRPQSVFRIGFNMLDTDMNQSIDKNEFLLLEKIFSNAKEEKRAKTPKVEQKPSHLESQQHNLDTTLLIHFFGPKGNSNVTFEDFEKFMFHLQKEILEVEFMEFSRGSPTISEVDFARILLKYTYLDRNKYEKYLERLLDRIKNPEDITFEEFLLFFQFLNNFKDFSSVMRMYILADHPLSKEEFHRAVKICTEADLNTHLVNTVFALFDEDGDGRLSYKEFIDIMKNRRSRDFKSNGKNDSWQDFKKCMKYEMTHYAS